MSLIIFFGFALMIFLGGVMVISVTLFHWYKEYRERQIQNKTQTKKPVTATN